METFDPEYADELTRLVHSWSERSCKDLTDMFSGEIAAHVTKVVTRWCPDERPMGMWVFVDHNDKASVFTPDMMLGYSGAGPAYCEIFLKNLAIPAELVDDVSTNATRHREDREVVVAFSRTDEGWNTDIEFGTKK